MKVGRIGKIGKLIFFIVVLVLLVILGVFLWKDENPDIGLIRFEEFTIEQTPQGKIIRHEKTGFEVTIPSDWEIVDGRDRVYFNSLDFEADKDNSTYVTPIAKNGCVHSINIEKNEGVDPYSNYQHTKDAIVWCLENAEYCEDEIIKINNNDSIKHVSSVDNEAISGNHIRIEIPKNENIYMFEAYLFGEDRENCKEEFNRILETVKIK